jgi:hypothetical protein
MPTVSNRPLGQGPNFAPRQGDNYAPGQGPNFAPRQGDNYAPGQGPNFAPRQGDNYAAAMSRPASKQAPHALRFDDILRFLERSFP